MALFPPHATPPWLLTRPSRARTPQSCSAGSRAHVRSIFERGGSKVVVDEGSLALLDGSTIDFEETMMSASFVVLDNPQSGSSCGCGTSFQAKE